MDLSQLDTVAAAEEGTTMNLRHPVSGEDLMGVDGEPMTLTLMGADSGTFKRAAANAMGAKKGNKKMTVADGERAVVNLLAKVTIGMSPNWTWNDEPFKFTEDNVKRLYTERPWIRQQVDEFIADRSNFLDSN